MSLPEIKQAQGVLTQASSIMLAVPPKPSVDSFASMLALYLALLSLKQGNTVDAVSPSHVPSDTQFLPGSSQTHMEPTIEPEIVLDIAGTHQITATNVEQLRGGNRLHIRITPGDQELLKEHVEVSVRELPYDAVVVFGAPDLEDLGDMFTNHADFFYSTPIINIDHRPTNEYFGTINLVDITASSIAEITHELLISLSQEDITKDIATALYAGIVDATDSFQRPSTTPRAFQLAANLLDAHADKESVIQHLVKTKPLHLLKLAGRTYARLRHDEYGQLFWSILRALDFTESNATPEHIPDVMHELTNNISGYNAAFILYEDEAKRYTVYLTIGKGLIKRREEIQEALGATRENGALVITLTALSLEEAEQRALEMVRSIVPQVAI